MSKESLLTGEGLYVYNNYLKQNDIPIALEGLTDCDLRELIGANMYSFLTRAYWIRKDIIKREIKAKEKRSSTYLWWLLILISAYFVTLSVHILYAIESPEGAAFFLAWCLLALSCAMYTASVVVVFTRSKFFERIGRS